MFRLSYLLAAFFLLVSPALTAAQEETPTEVEAEALRANDKQAFELLETIAGGIPSLRAVENRIYLTNAVADLLWTRDEKRARGLFDTVTREMVSVVANFDPSDQEHNELWTIQQERQEIMERMAHRDPAMAMAFLKATRPPITPESGQFRANEMQLELHLAGLMAAEDPAQALRIARANLRKGSLGDVIPLLSQIGAKDRDSAQSLYGEIVDQLKNEDLARNHEVTNVAWTLLNSYQPPEAKEETYRELIDLLVGSVLSISPRDSTRVSFAQNNYGQLRPAMTEIEKYAPGRVPALREWIQGVRRTQDPGMRVNEEFSELAEKGTVDDILALASKYPPEYQPQIQDQAMWKALNSGDPNRARQIVSELVSDPVRRQQMLGQLENQMAWSKVQENQIAEARRMLSRVKSVDQRVNMLISMARNVASKGDKKQSLDLLAEARTVLDSSPQDASKLNLRMQLAQNYSSLDSEQGVALLESIVLRVNQLVAAAVILDGIEQRYLKEGEWQKANYSSLGNLINTLSQQLGELARHDPAGACYLSNQLERPEIRLMAQLAIAQSLFAGMPPHHGTMAGRSVMLETSPAIH